MKISPWSCSVHRPFLLIGGVVLFLLSGAVISTQTPLAESGAPNPIHAIEPLLSFDQAHQGSDFFFAVRVEMTPSWHVNAHKPSLEYLIPTELRFTPSPVFHFAPPDYPGAVLKAFAFAEAKLAVYEDTFVIRARGTVSQSAPIGPQTVEATFFYQACDDTRCLAPSEIPLHLSLEVVENTVAIQPINQSIFADDYLAPPEENSSVTNVATLISERGLLIALFTLFLGGLALNLTPCVYPIIPITIAYFGGQSHGRSFRTFRLSLCYVLGISVTYSTLGVVASTSGTMLGAVLQSPIVLLAFAALMIVFGLSMLGVFSFEFSHLLPGSLQSKHGYVGALIMGTVVGVTAAPCIGPVILGLMVYVSQQANAWLGFWLFFALSLGLGFPYLFLGTFSGTLARLPQAGGWMVSVKKAFGLALFGMAFYFLYPLLPGQGFWLAFSLYLIGSGIYFGFFEGKTVPSPQMQWAKRVVALSVMGLGIFLLVPRTEPLSIQWTPYEQTSVVLIQTSGKPVIIDFSAEWCLPCKELDAITFSEPDVIQKAKDFLTLKADLTQYSSPAVEKLREQYQVLGVPTIVFLDRNGNELPELRQIGFVGPERFLKIMEKAL